MDMDNQAGWHSLCGFLGQTIPNVKYPVAFATPVILEETKPAKSWFKRAVDWVRSLMDKLHKWSETH